VIAQDGWSKTTASAPPSLKSDDASSIDVTA
jgi:hypothetical protein